jgi:hypothetical protein
MATPLQEEFHVECQAIELRGRERYTPLLTPLPEAISVCVVHAARVVSGTSESTP